MRALVPVVVLVLAAGCSRAPDVPADFEQALAAFRAEQEADISGATGPLSTVDAWYVEPGHRLSMWVESGHARRSLHAVDEPPPADAKVSIVVRDDAIACTHGCGGTHVAIDEPRTIAVPPLSLGLSAQSGGLRVLVHDPAASARTRGAALAWYPPAPAWRLVATLAATPDAEPEPLATTRGLVKPMRPAGTLTLALPEGNSAELVAFEAGPGELLVPFTDATNGDGTYDVGRYLTVSRPADAADLVVDFNRATNPWCAYSEHYNCPIPPAKNRLEARVEAGERHPRVSSPPRSVASDAGTR